MVMVDCSFLAAYRRAYGSRLIKSVSLIWSKGRQPSGAVLHS